MAQQKRYDRAYKEAVKQLEQDRINEIKALVKKTLEALAKAEKDRQDAVERTQLLKRDIEDLKAGKLDRIKERHEKNTKADQQSPINIKEIEKILLTVPTVTTPFKQVSDNTTIYWPDVAGTAVGSDWKITYGNYCKTVADAVPGTYVLADGTVKYV